MNYVYSILCFIKVSTQKMRKKMSGKNSRSCYYSFFAFIPHQSKTKQHLLLYLRLLYRQKNLQTNLLLL